MRGPFVIAGGGNAGRRGALVAALIAAFTITAAAPPAIASDALGIDHLRVDYIANPLGIDDPHPHLSWELTSDLRGQSQRAYQVRAATSRRLLAVGRPDLWDSGVRSGDDVNVTYGGAPLRSRQAVYWQVRAWGSHGSPSGWSRVASWEMGLLDRSDWSAQWIADEPPSHPAVVRFPAVDARYVRLDVTKLGLPLPNDGSRLQLAELVVADSAVPSTTHPSTSLARGAAVTASESYDLPGQWLPRYLTDGETRGARPFGYSSDDRSDPDLGDSSIWLQVDLGRVRHFDELRIYPRTDVLTGNGRTPNFPVDFTVQTAQAADGPFTVAARKTDQPPPPPIDSSSTELPLFAKQFDLPDEVRSARLYLTGLGVQETTVNGARVTDAVLEPPQTDYRKRILYSTYDVTDLLRKGENAIGVMLGDGLFDVQSTPGRNPGPEAYAPWNFVPMGSPRLLAQLEVTLADGTTRRIVSDDSWRTTLGPVTYSNWYGGEDYDARRAQPGWDRPGADLSSWRQAEPTDSPAPDAVLSAPIKPPIKVVDRLEPTRITEPKPGTYVFDFGTQFVGWTQLEVRGRRGTRVVLRPGEQLAPDGTVDQRSMKAYDYTAPIWDSYTLAGTGIERWRPRFRYTGLRYVEVTGLPEPPTAHTLTGLVLRTAAEPAGAFTSSAPLLNRIHQMIERGIASNLMNPGTSDPNREKLGWLEETHLVFGSMSRSYDIAAQDRALVRNMADAQDPDGLVPDTAPEFSGYTGAYRDDPNWGSAFIQVPWQLYRTYGDEDTMRRYYGDMQEYLDYLMRRADDGIIADTLGDWGTLDATPPAVTGTYAYFRSARTMSRIAAALGRHQDAERYADLAAGIGQAFNDRFLDSAHGTYANGTQAADALALDMNVVPDEDRHAVLDHLIAGIRARGNHLTVGEIAQPALLRVLSAAGRDDVLYDVVDQVGYPGWGHHVLLGATSLPEYWDGSGEQSMYMMGAVDEWFSTGLAGLRSASDGVGFDKLVVAPAVVGGLTHAEARYETPYGAAASDWTRSGSQLQLSVRVPVGATATVRVPFADRGDVTASGGARLRGIEGDRAVYEVGSGLWSFVAQTGERAVKQEPIYLESLTGEATVVSEPGWTGRAAFRLYNVGDDPVTVRPRVVVSDGFEASLDADAVQIPARGRADVEASVEQEDAAAREGSVSLQVAGRTATVPVVVTDDVVRGAVMTASSTYPASGFAPAGAADGDTSSDTWGTGNGWNDDTANEFPDTLTAEWTQPTEISRARVFTLDSAMYPSASFGLRDYDVEARVDGQWRTVTSVRGSTTGAVERVFDPVTATGVRLVVRDSNDHAFSRVVELEAYRE